MKQLHVLCDIPRCFAALVLTDVNSFTTARIVSDREGWTHRDGKDYCPVHSDKPAVTADVGALDETHTSGVEHRASMAPQTSDTTGG